MPPPRYTGGSNPREDPYGGPNTTPGESSFDDFSEGIPLWGDLTGANARNANRRASAAGRAGRDAWLGLIPQNPDAEQQAAGYEFGSPSIQDSGAAGQRGYSYLNDVVSHGGMTEGGRAGFREAAQMAGRQGAAGRAAAQAGFEARGGGASGGAYAQQLLGEQGAADQAGMAAYEGAREAERGRMAAAAGLAGIGEEEANRRFGYQSQLAQARERARQQSFENLRDVAAGVSGQYGNQQNRQDEANQNSQKRQSDLFSSFLSMFGA